MKYYIFGILFKMDLAILILILGEESIFWIQISNSQNGCNWVDNFVEFYVEKPSVNWDCHQFIFFLFLLSV